MRENFAEKFIDFIKNSAKFVDDLIKPESMHYKTLRMGGNDPEKIYKGFKNLEKRGILRQHSEGFKFTTNGRKWLKKANFKYFKLKNKHWDKKWRVVIFDVPQELNKSRDRFRNRLKSLGFYMMQKSVFVIPYPCEEELRELCQESEINGCVDIIVADSVGSKEDEIRKFFEI
ncbi:MAG: CRISPR-associated endonuclease Cas2 [Candidatus Paceibacterota bacterium]